MNNKITDMEKIDLYNKGLLSDDQKAEITLRIMDDEDFRNLFDDLEIMAEGIRKSAAETSVEEKLAKLKASIHLEGFETDKSANHPEADEEIKLTPLEKQDPKADKLFVLGFPVAKIFHRYKVAIAATVSLVIVAWFALNQLIPVSEEKLFAENFVPYHSTSGSTRGNTENENTIDKAHLAYASENYASAVGFFEELESQPDFSLIDRFYLGNAYLAIGENEKAVAAFKEVTEAQTGLTHTAKWYLGLSYLQTGELAKAKEVFGELAELDKDYAEEAEDILDNLD